MERCTLAQSWADVSVIIYLFIWTLVSEQLVISQTHPNKPVGLRTPPVLHGKVDSSEILTCPEETRITVQKIKSEGTSFLFTKQSVSGPSKQRCTEEIPFDTFTHLQPFPIPCCFNHHREGGNRKLNEWWNKVTAIWLTKMWCIYRTPTSCRQWMTSSFCWMITLLRLRQYVALPSSNQ